MKQGDHITKARAITLTLVFAAVIASLAFDIGLGTPSSFGIGQFFLLCPLGGIEALLASKAFVPVTLISLTVVVVFALLFGRAWCAWGCPAPGIRGFFKRNPKIEIESDPVGNIENRFDNASKGTPCNSKKSNGAPWHKATSSACTNDCTEIASDSACKNCASSTTPRTCSATCEAKGLAASLRHLGHDKRTWILGAVLLATLIAGIPLFCLVCPIGLTFGTVGSLWHLVVDKQMTLSAMVFPAALAVELVLYRKWCLNLCPVAGLLNVFGQAAKLFRPRIDASTCLRTTEGKPCTVCVSVCPERINLHANDAALQLGECTRCGECVKHCPTTSIRIGAKPQGSIPRS